MPRGLSRKARELWRRVAASVALDDAGLVALELVCRTYDRWQQVRKVIDREGLTVQDPSGRIRAHPLLTTEKDCRLTLLRALRQLPGQPEGESWYRKLLTDLDEG